MSVFTSSTQSVSFVDHAVSAFGRSAMNAVVKSHAWGDVLIISEGEHEGSYDIHNNNGVVTFIAA